ncbi:MAG: glycosyltransferase family 39 protein [Pseudomonadota bacterium]
MDGEKRFDERKITIVTLSLLAMLLVFRVGAIVIADYDLYADEAQYWRWSRVFDWGYYSKPPLVAWVIGASTLVFGSAEWAIRLPAPILHTAAAGALFMVGRAMYGPLCGALAALGYALMPGVIVSSAVISTDGVLLPVWSFALWQYWRLRVNEGGWLTPLLLGAAIGVSFLAKYAALYFIIGVALTTLMDLETRRAVLSRKGVVVALIALVVVTPHLAWNLSNEFQTVSHTVDNANLGGPLFNLDHLPKFLADQMGVFGPVGFLTLIGGVFVFPRAARPYLAARDRWLLCFILPVLIIICFQAVLSRAHANWAATAYPAASVLVAAWLLRASANRTLWFVIAGVTAIAAQLMPDISMTLKLLVGLGFAAGILAAGAAVSWRPVGLLVAALGLHGLLMVSAMTLFASPPGITASLGVDNALKRVRGWDDTARQVIAAADEIGATAILVDEREVWHGLDYYGREQLPAPLIAWRRNPGIKSFSETQLLTDTLDDTVLVASYRPGFRPRIRGDFEQMERIGVVEIALGERSSGCPIVRRLVLYRASGFSPQDRSGAWEDQYRDLREAPSPVCPPLS